MKSMIIIFNLVIIALGAHADVTATIDVLPLTEIADGSSIVFMDDLTLESYKMSLVYREYTIVWYCDFKLDPESKSRFVTIKKGTQLFISDVKRGSGETEYVFRLKAYNSNRILNVNCSGETLDDYYNGLFSPGRPMNMLRFRKLLEDNKIQLNLKLKNPLVETIGD